MDYRQITRMTSVIVIAALISGCALMDGRVNVTYSPDPTKKSALVTVAPTVVVLRIEDQREASEKGLIGNKRNGFGMVTASIKSDKEPTVIIYDALKDELLNSGHKVVTVSDRTADVGILIALKRFWSDLSIHFWDLEFVGTLDANITIRDAKNDSVLLSKPLSSAFRESRQLGTDSAFESVLTGVLGEFVRNFARDPEILRVLGQRLSVTQTN